MNGTRMRIDDETKPETPKPKEMTTEIIHDKPRKRRLQHEGMHVNQKRQIRRRRREVSRKNET